MVENLVTPRSRLADIVGAGYPPHPDTNQVQVARVFLPKKKCLLGVFGRRKPKKWNEMTLDCCIFVQSGWNCE